MSSRAILERSDIGVPVSNRGSKFLSYLYGVPSDFEMTPNKNFSKSEILLVSRDFQKY